MCLVARADKVLVDSLMDQLEDVIAHREVFLAAKEKRLEDLYAALKSEKDERKRFYLLTDLYVEYHPFNSDSAYNVSLRQETLAKRIGDPVLVTNARMNRANILCTTGMYSETLAFMDTMRLYGRTIPIIII